MRSMPPRIAVTVLAALLLATAPGMVSPALAADDYEIEAMEKVKRGEKKVKVRSDVKEAGLICKLKVKYANGNVDTVGEVESNKKGFCEIEFDVPDENSVVGTAMAKLRVETKKGDEKGSATRGFWVRKRRGG